MAMHGLLEILVVNTVSAGVLALIVVSISRFVRRPALIHGLWVLVLLKLLVPPVFEIAVLPASWTAPAHEAAPAPSALPVSTVVVEASDGFEPAGRETALPSPGALLLAFWVCGTLGLLSLGVWRIRTFGRLLRATTRPPRWLLEQAHGLARALGIARAPRVRMLSARVAPMLWCPPGSRELLMPAALLSRLDTEECRAVVAHELAHLKRRDHWIRYLESAATLLHWWNPLLWWVRRRLRLAEETSCDALALAAFRGSPRTYAEGLLKTLDFLVASGSPGVPAVATGAGEAHQLKERLTMILSHRRPATTTPLQRWTLAAFALVALLVAPAGSDADLAAHEPPAATPEELRLQQQAMELEHELRQVQARRMQLTRAMDVERAAVQADELRRHAEELRLEGRSADADRVEAHLEELERRQAMEAEAIRLELELHERSNDIELDLGRLMLQIETLQADGDDEGARALEERARALSRDLDALHLEVDRRRQLVEREMQAQALADVVRRQAELEDAGRTDEARELAQVIAQHEIEQRQMELQRYEDEVQLRLELQRMALAQQHEELLTQGETTGAEEIESRLRELDELEPERIVMLEHELESVLARQREHREQEARLAAAAEEIRAELERLREAR
jgi:beta-lactamase regulating signal transducer with metallopeptidase domain